MRRPLLAAMCRAGAHRCHDRLMSWQPRVPEVLILSFMLGIAEIWQSDDGSSKEIFMAFEFILSSMLGFSGDLAVCRWR